jgi:uncharacterized protein (UPF0305 family)
MYNTFTVTDSLFQKSINLKHMKILQNTDYLLGNEEIITKIVNTEEITKLLPLYYQYIHQCPFAVIIIVYISSIRKAPLHQYGASQITASTVRSYFSRYICVILTKIWLPLRTNTEALDFTQNTPLL